MQEEKGLADEEARERDALYERAERLVLALLSIQDKLREAIDCVNEGVSPPHSQSPSGLKVSIRLLSGQFPKQPQSPFRMPC